MKCLFEKLNYGVKVYPRPMGHVTYGVLTWGQFSNYNRKSLITSKRLEIDMWFLLTTHRKLLVGFGNMRSDVKFGAP